MNFVRKIHDKTIFAADFGAESVVVLAAEWRSGGPKLLGGGDFPARGVENGRLVSVGDAAESVVEALRKAERASGAVAGTVYFNYDDPSLESAHARGSKTLKGEGEITPDDVREASANAERALSRFERRPLYARETRFVIDDKDAVADPVGVFGRKLDVTLHMLSADAAHYDAWKRVFERAGVSRSVAVPSPWSAAWGALRPGERGDMRLVVDAGRDFLNIFIHGNKMIRAFRAVQGDAAAAAEAARALMADEPALEAVVTGDCAEDSAWVDRFRSLAGLPVRAAAPTGIERLASPRFAAAVGLVEVADELEAKPPLLRHDGGIVGGAKEKLVAFLNEYF